MRFLWEQEQWSLDLRASSLERVSLKDFICEDNNGSSGWASIIYKACVAVAIRNFEPQAMKLITAILFLVVLVISMGGKKKVKGMLELKGISKYYNVGSVNEMCLFSGF